MDIVKKRWDLFFQGKSSHGCGRKMMRKKSHACRVHVLYHLSLHSAVSLRPTMLSTASSLLHCFLHSEPKLPPSRQPSPAVAFNCTWIFIFSNVFMFIRSQTLPRALLLESLCQTCSDLFQSFQCPPWIKQTVRYCYVIVIVLSEFNHYAGLPFLSFVEQTSMKWKWAYSLSLCSSWQLLSQKEIYNINMTICYFLYTVYMVWSLDRTRLLFPLLLIFTLSKAIS